jgi:proteic killer suppression protein
MIKDVVLSRKTRKQMVKVPAFVRDKLLAWVLAVQKNGLEIVRKVPGFHDEPLQGHLKGLRSIRLSRSYRAYYRILHDQVEFVFVEGVDKHGY